MGRISPVSLRMADRILQQARDLADRAHMRADNGLVDRKFVAQALEGFAMFNADGILIGTLECPVQLVKMPALAGIGSLEVEIVVIADRGSLLVDRRLDAADNDVQAVRRMPAQGHWPVVLGTVPHRGRQIIHDANSLWITRRCDRPRQWRRRRKAIARLCAVFRAEGLTTEGSAYRPVPSRDRRRPR